MKIVFRPLAPKETDLELIFGIVLLMAFVCGGCILLSGLTTLPACPLKALFGIPCVGCGSTRAARALLHGHPIDAFWFNPLATASFFAAVIWMCHAFAVAGNRLSPRLRLIRFTSESRWILGALVLANWAYVIWHLG